MVWESRNPRVYRFIEKEFADAFFATGELRLSSFKQFAKHKDEQRLDGLEGTARVMSKAIDDPGLMWNGQIRAGQNAYVLSTSLVPSNNVMAEFGCDSGIVIHAVKKFAEQVGAKIPGFYGGFDGPCSYQANRIVTFSHGNHQLKEEDFLTPAAVEFGMLVAGADPFFLKHHKFLPQNEWRFVWLVDHDVDDFIKISVPEAVPCCMRWEFTEQAVAF